MSTPTEEIYGDFQRAYAYFNGALFADQLPDCLITMQRHARNYGYFRCQPFVNRDGQRTDEISLNPRFFLSRSVLGVCSTLVHEMAHLHQFRFGKPSRAGYHNRPWADKMIDLGLYPTSSGKPGGRETGYRVTHYIVEHGRFDVSCSALLANGFHFSWIEKPDIVLNLIPPTARAVSGAADSSNRWKYTCPHCSNNAWGKPDLPLICGQCMVSMPRG